MSGDDVTTVQALLSKAGLLPAEAQITLTPLTGGVSCDVWRVDHQGAPVAVVKRALAQLKVEAEWFAPLDRTESEVRWLKRASTIVPGLAPRILADDPADHIFAMDYLPPDQHPVWKDELFAGRVDVGFAAAVGRKLAKLHSATANDADIAREFDTGDLFADLRIDPFLRHVAGRHPDLSGRLLQLADDLAAAKVALVHGDVSPKNILMGPSGPVLLDAECAVYGDPAFDAAFCLTHLLLKVVHLPQSAQAMRQSAHALTDAYLAGADWEPADQLSARTSDLVAALLLARIDGKSPASYIQAPAEQNRIRDAAMFCLSHPPRGLTELIAGWPFDGESSK